MKSLFSFSSGGGLAFPGSPVAGVYLAATLGEFLTICADVLSVQYSIVIDTPSGGLIWYSDGAQMVLVGGSVLNSSEYPTPGTAGGVTFAVSSEVAIYDFDDGNFYYYDGTNWIQLV